MNYAEFHLELDAPERDKVLFWLTAHGLDTRDVRGFEVKGDAIIAEVISRDEHGHPYLEPSEPTRPATTFLTVPLEGTLAPPT